MQQGNRKKKVARRSLCIEPLEPRIVLSTSGLVEVGQQPVGALSGHIVYTHAGHGWTANNSGDGSWTTQRGEWHEIVEDLGNQDQMTFLADYLFRAGATVVPLRPVGHQTNEVVLDNDDPGVTFSGAWSHSTGSVYFGSAGDTPYRYASTSVTETAYARYQPDLPEAGFYPVYAWTRSGSDRASDQLYRIHHTGGTTEVTVNHRLVGNGLVYLGTYYFNAGSEGYVDISNRSNDSEKIVVADMIRFGNGMGDIDRGGGVSGKPREDEAGLYWVMWHVNHSQGISESEYRSSSDDRTATVSLSPRYAEYMNRSSEGSLSDRVFVSFHSNGATGDARGVFALYNGNNDPSTATPNQYLLANLLGREVNDDLVAQNGQFEHDWYNRSVVTLDRSDIEFGEINNVYIDNEFDATIVETGFHDNQEDAEMLRDPRVRDALARATYQGIVRYFNQVDGGATPVIMLPGQVADARAQSTDRGSVTVAWTPPAVNAYNGDAPTGYRIYMSLDGYGFDGGTFVPGGGTTTYTFTDLDPDAGVHYFRVVAINDGGESKPSEVVAALPNSVTANILIVNGFDRLERTLNPRESYFSGTIDRVRLRQSNSFDYVVPMAEAMEAYSSDLAIDSTSNDAVIHGHVKLTDYDHVFWILGEESTADRTLDAVEQNLVTAFLQGGGNLFVSGSEIGWDLDSKDNGRVFYENQLHANFVADDANTYNVTGSSSGIFHDLSFSFDNGSIFYNVDSPDRIEPLGGAITAASYSGGTGGTAAIQFDGGDSAGNLVLLAFPFETITNPASRHAVLARVLEFFEITESVGGIEIILDNDSGAPEYMDMGSWTISTSTGYNGGSYRFTTDDLATATWASDLPYAGSAKVFVFYRAASNRMTNTQYIVATATGDKTVYINQQENSLTWVQLGSFDFEAGPASVTVNAAASYGGSVIIADAVRFVLKPDDLAADFDHDHDVDGNDLSLWQDGFGTITGATQNDGDSDADGDVDGNDFLTWQQQFYAVPATGGSGAIGSETGGTAIAGSAAPIPVFEPVVTRSQITKSTIAGSAGKAAAGRLEPSRVLSLPRPDASLTVLASSGPVSTNRDFLKSKDNCHAIDPRTNRIPDVRTIASFSDEQGRAGDSQDSFDAKQQNSDPGIQIRKHGNQGVQDLLFSRLGHDHRLQHMRLGFMLPETLLKFTPW